MLAGRKRSSGSKDSSTQEELLQSIRSWQDASDANGSKELAVADFDLGRTIGRGRYARVRLAKLRGHTSIPICLKVMKKQDIQRLEQVDHILNEKNVLASASHPFIIRMLSTFQDTTSLYVALELANGGELFNLLRTQKRFKLAMAQFYAAEVTSALMYLHGMLIVYRDVKPENILIHRSGHVKLTDFGFAKYLKGERTFTLCGTPAYMAPEVILKAGHGLPVDWWGLGILLYEMLSGRAPFDAPEEEEILRQVVQSRILYPPVMDKTAKDLLMRLLMPDPLRRLGCAEATSDVAKTFVQQHAFFARFDWEQVGSGRVPPPWRPRVSDDDSDTSLFDRFEESDQAANAQSAGGAGPPVDHQEAFSSWVDCRNFREEALAAASELRERRAARLQEARQRLREEEEAMWEQVQMEEEKKQAQAKESTGKPNKAGAAAAAPPVSEVEMRHAHNFCCTLQ